MVHQNVCILVDILVFFIVLLAYEKSCYRLWIEIAGILLERACVEEGVH